MSFIILILSIFIIILLKKSNRQVKQRECHSTYYRKRQDVSSVHALTNTFTNNVMYRTNNKQLFTERRNQKHVYPIKSDLCIRRISLNPVYPTVSSQSLPSLISSPSNRLQPLSVHHLHKSYVQSFY